MPDALQAIDHECPFCVQLCFITQRLQVATGTPAGQRTGSGDAVGAGLTHGEETGAAEMLRCLHDFHFEDIAGNAIGDEQGISARSGDAVAANSQAFHGYREVLVYPWMTRPTLFGRHRHK